MTLTRPRVVARASDLEHAFSFRGVTSPRLDISKNGGKKAENLNLNDRKKNVDERLEWRGNRG